MTVRLGVIADDFTGATDIAGFLVSNGLRTVQVSGVPTDEPPLDEVDAIVVSLKSRSIPSTEAVDLSLGALRWLQQVGAERFFFKYCSTFDSTPAGNIGPVTDALLDALGEDLTVICPSLPVNGRSVYFGYLFAGAVPLNESGMEHHPVTPMTDANLMRVMEAQSTGSAGNVPWDVVEQGPQAVVDALEVDVDRLLADPDAYRAEALAWVLDRPQDGPAPLVFATAPPEHVKALQARHGAERTSAAIEDLFAWLATALREAGVTRFIVAGGETSGAVSTSLRIDGFHVGPQIAPGVPWVRSLDGTTELALKSGNFGDVDFFARAQQQLA